MAWSIVAAPTELPVSLQEAKDHCVVTITDDDLFIMDAINAAVQYAQKFQGMHYITTTVDETFDGFCSIMRPSLAPVQSITSITYLDTSGVSTVLATSKYQTDVVTVPARIVPAPTESWPVVESGRMSPITIRYVVGYGNAQKVPQNIRTAILQLVSHIYSNRDAVDLVALKEVPMAVENLLSLDRVWQF